jgi:hypothetical protein
MSSLVEIEAAIEKLPATQVEELATWLETLRWRRDLTAPVECMAGTCAWHRPSWRDDG